MSFKNVDDDAVKAQEPPYADGLRVVVVDIQEWSPTHPVLVATLSKMILMEDLLDSLGDEKASKRIRAFRYPKDAQRALIGRLLPLWELCCDTSTCSWSALQQDKASKGRPFLVHSGTNKRTDYDFNISHDGPWVAMLSKQGSTDWQLGVDVVPLSLPTGIPTVRELEETVYPMLSSAEKGLLALSAPSATLNLLLKAWAAKEAVSKALGDGLSFPYEQIDTYDLLVNNEQQASITVKKIQCAVACHLLRSKGGEESILALAVLGASATASIQGSLASIRIEKVAVETIVKQVLRQAGKNSPAES